MAQEASITSLRKARGSRFINQLFRRIDVAAHIRITHSIGHHQIHRLASDRGKLLLQAEVSAH
ncbi:MAG: hypothetical protein ACK55I_10535, partial [bacterium]